MMMRQKLECVELLDPQQQQQQQQQQQNYMLSSVYPTSVKQDCSVDEADVGFSSVYNETGGKAGFCAGCGDRIADRYYLLAVDKQWHASCLSCSVCKVSLDSQNTCFAKDGQIYCKEDYQRIFMMKTCSQCGLNISSDELVMRVRHLIYHIQCFACSACGKQLNTGEHFSLNDRHIYCQQHYEMYVNEEDPLYSQSSDPRAFHSFLNYPGMDPTLPPSTHPSLGYYCPVTGPQPPSSQKGRPRKRKNNSSNSEHFLPVMGDELMSGGHDESLLQHPRQKRMRTSFKHHQLRIMKSYFSLNHNPDAKDLKQLAQKTGLSKRVLQVWFQNARAKHRRSVSKDGDKETSQTGGSNPTGPSNLKQKDNIGDVPGGSPASDMYKEGGCGNSLTSRTEKCATEIYENENGENPDTPKYDSSAMYENDSQGRGVGVYGEACPPRLYDLQGRSYMGSVRGSNCSRYSVEEDDLMSSSLTEFSNEPPSPSFSDTNHTAPMSLHPGSALSFHHPAIPSLNPSPVAHHSLMYGTPPLPLATGRHVVKHCGSHYHNDSIELQHGSSASCLSDMFTSTLQAIH